MGFLDKIITVWLSTLSNRERARERERERERERDWPAEDTEDKVEDEERADDDETDEVDPRPTVAMYVVDLCPPRQQHTRASILAALSQAFSSKHCRVYRRLRWVEAYTTSH